MIAGSDECARIAPGLTSREAADRLSRYGPNELPPPDHQSAFGIALEVLREPMFALLVAAAAVYAVIGDIGEALVLGLFATVSVSIAIVQRGRSERVLEKLRDLTSPRALVIRDGERRRVPGREVVPGDVLVVTEGDRIAADSVLVEGANITVDESLLTGESLPVRKVPTQEPGTAASAPGGDDLPHLYSGTLLLRGTGIARVTATGLRSEIGRIGKSVGSIEVEQPRLRRQTRRLVVIFASVGLTLSAVAVVLYGVLRGDWLQALLGGIALGMSMLPEEFPLVLTVFMVMGAWRLSRSRILTRRAASIETLGAATVLCTDKTGTLTLNAMKVVALQCDDARWNSDESVETLRGSPALTELIELGWLASEPQGLDPMERAIQAIAQSAKARPEPGATLVRSYPLTPELLAVTQVWQKSAQAPCIVVAKGAPEAILQMAPLDADRRASVLDSVDALARQGIRVLCVARGSCAQAALPSSAGTFSLQFVGLIGLADPLRESVPAAVQECRAAGIRVIMITGDYPQTARAIAREAGIGEGALVTGSEMEALDEAQLRSLARTATVFARIRPQQKLRIVEALKANGETVAMTGDGVNDAPALKAAHIGIAMGGRGTDVAREAAAIVLLDDDFGSIVRAIRVGRRIYDNLRKAFAYILAIHIPIAGLALVPIVRGEALLLTPMLIAFLELIIDPACSIVLEAEPEEEGIMRRPPRKPKSPLISRALLGWSLLQGVAALLVVTAIYAIAVARELPQDEVRALSFVALVGVNLALIFATRSFGASLISTLTRHNVSLFWGLGLVAASLAVVLGLPTVREFFGLSTIAMDDLLLCLAASAGLLWALGLLKRLWGARLLA